MRARAGERVAAILRGRSPSPPSPSPPPSIHLSSLLASKSDSSRSPMHVSRSGLKKPKQHGDQSLLSTNIGIQGVIYCRSGSKLVPLQGARVRVTCLAMDERGYETAPFCILSRPTDANGYFSVTLSPSEVEDDWKLTRCKAFLESSPSETCKVLTDVNRGVTGALLSSYRLSKDKRMKWFSVGPFVYTS